MPIIFLNRFFYPDHSATSQLLSDLVFALADHGGSVRVITSRQLYDSPNVRLPVRDTIRGVEVHRVWTSRFGRERLIGRAADYLTFYVSAAWRLWRLARAGDIVVAKTDPPMFSVLAAPIARRRGAKLVNWLQDIFPEVAEAVGMGGGRLSRGAYRIMRALRTRSLRSACVNVVLGERMAERLRVLGVPAHSIRIIPNWADGSLVRPIQHSANRLRREWGLVDTFVVGYSGNLGRVHEFETMLDAIEMIERGAGPLGAEVLGPSRLLWLFVGGGALHGELRAQVDRRGLNSVMFRPYQPRECLAESLSAADVHLVSLQPDLEGLVVPSKIYGILAAGRPALFIGDKGGEIARLLARHDCGRTIAVGAGTALACSVLELARDPALCRSMGLRARRTFESEFDKKASVARWARLLVDLSQLPEASAKSDTVGQAAVSDPVTPILGTPAALKGAHSTERGGGSRYPHE
jgi:colanic acid biosynthesis glycosyl transferase WcaI